MVLVQVSYIVELTMWKYFDCVIHNTVIICDTSVKTLPNKILS